MTQNKAKPKTKHASRANGTAKVMKTAKTRTTTKGPAKIGAKAKSGSSDAGKPALLLLDQQNRDLRDWREETLARMRALILEADPEMTEERKWKKPSNRMAGVPVWSHNGIVCTGETYKKVVKLTFAQGRQHPGPIGPLQFQPGRQHAKGDRHPRRGAG